MLGPISGFDIRDNQFVVGRDKEIEEMRTFLNEQSTDHKHVWNLYGTGGVGKSTLLQVFRMLAHQADTCFLYVDSRDFPHTPQGLCNALIRQCRSCLVEDVITDQDNLTDACVHLLQTIAARQKTILAFDTFEEMAGLEAWLRDDLLKWLDSNVLVLIAGRLPLKGAWLLSAAWRERIRFMPIEHLKRTDALEYLQRCGIDDETRREHILLQSKGHPLTLSLAVAAQSAATSQLGTEDEWFVEIASLWLKEVPDRDLRKWVEAAAILRHFNQELLSHLLEEPIEPDIFDRLTKLSFVRKSERGWVLHDLMRDATCSLLKERSPSFYANLVKRCALYYATVILESSGRTDMAWEVGELFHYVGNPMTRTLMSTAASSKFYWEPLTESTLADANAYIEHRRQTARSISLYGLDPETGKERLYSSSRESWLYMLKDVEVESWLNLDSRSVKLMRSHTGEVLALALIVPIHSGTLPVLKQDPLCGPYLASLSPAELRQLDVPPDRPAGWFNRSLDVSDVTDPDLRADVMKMFYSYICMGGLFIASPPATEMNELAHLSVGFEVVEGVSHTFYDGRTPTPTYVLDTRKERLKSYLARLMHHLSIPFEIHGSRPTLVEASRASSQLVEPLTKREQEVADLVLAGFSNAEIGTRLFLSEVTVKKHLTSVFAKMGVKTRSQLVRMMLQGEGE